MPSRTQANHASRLARQMRLLDEEMAHIEKTPACDPQEVMDKLELCKFQLASFAIENMWFEDSEVRFFIAMIRECTPPDEIVARILAKHRLSA